MRIIAALEVTGCARSGIWPVASTGVDSTQ